MTHLVNDRPPNLLDDLGIGAPAVDFQGRQQRCAGPPRFMDHHVVDTGPECQEARPPAAAPQH